MSVLESAKLGAFDLKKSANRNLLIGFCATVLLFLLLIGTGEGLSRGSGNGEGDELIGSGPVTLDQFLDEEKAQEEEIIEEPEFIPPPPPPPSVIPPENTGTGADVRMGALEAVDQELDLPKLANMDQQGLSDALGEGDGLPDANWDEFELPQGELGDKDKELPSQDPPEEYPDFLPNTKPPTYNPGELMANVQYPAIAQENGIEGRVILSISLSKTGKPDKIEILKSDNKLFDQEAVAAVKKTNFTPAIQNGLAVRYKLTVTVEFKLR